MCNYNLRLYQEMIGSPEYFDDANNASIKMINKKPNVGKL